MTSALMPIYYRIIPDRPEAHTYKVVCTISQPAAEGQRVWLPAWIPGSYMIRDFAKNIISLSASCNHQRIAVDKLDKQTWQCAVCAGPLIIEYEVYAWDLSVRAAHLDITHAYFNGTSVFLAVTDQENSPCEVDIVRPVGPRYATWRVATTLSHKAAADYGFGTYHAANYDELIDHPVEIGDFALSEFSVAGTPHAIAITGRQQADLPRLTRDVQVICEQQVQMFGELPDMDRYLFLLTVIDNGFGGLEHRASTSLLASRKSLPHTNMTQPTDDYINLLGLFSHEYFHTWHVKQIKPQEFIPYNLQREVHTHLLWAFEGITSYYDDLGLVRSGVISTEKYLELLGKAITKVIREPGRFKQSLPESSFEAWTKYYKQDENSPNAIVSYYVKGSLFALCLDLYIRQQTHQCASLDDVMRRLWTEFAKVNRGLSDDSIKTIVAELCGKNVDTFFQTYLEGTQDLPLTELLAQVGIDLHLRTTMSEEDLGGKEGDKKEYSIFSLGGRFANDAAGVKVTHAYDNGALQHAGISAGDVLLAANGIKLSKDNLRTVLAPYRIGDRLHIHAFRRDELMEFDLTLVSAEATTCYLKWQTDGREKAKTWIAYKDQK